MENDVFLGKYVIARSNLAGVFAGTLESRRGNWATLRNARRLWYWKAAASLSLSGVARHGLEYAASKIPPPVDAVEIEPFELVIATELARASIENAPEVQP